MMSLKVLHAGDGYAYLTRQVATGDNARTRGELMADYYTAHGAPAGQWWGKGAAQLGVSGEVTEEQMLAAYGEFLHPEANEKIGELIRSGAGVTAAINAVRLGRRAPDFNRDNPFLMAVKQQTIEFTQAHAAVPTPEEIEDIERIVARRMLTDIDAGATDAERRFGVIAAQGVETMTGDSADGFVPDCLGTEDQAVRHTAPITSDRITAFIAQAKREARYPVAGYDMVFTPAKSISVLWGIGDETTRTAIMKAHSEAVESSLQWIEDNAVFTRAGAQGQEKIDCDGATVAKFLHFDNRAGDPNLHTHCAMLNRVHCTDGRYRTVDGTVLHRAAVTASEHYNQRVTELVARYLEVEFEPVVKSRGGRPVWEIKGIPTELMRAMSRRDDVMDRGRELLEDYRKTYGRTPPKHVQYKLMEQANLETRAAKAAPRSLQEMVEQWRGIADTTSPNFNRQSVLEDVYAAGDTYLADPGPEAPEAERDAYETQQAKRRVPYSPGAEDTIVDRVMDALARERSSWTEYQITSETSRQCARFIFCSDEQKAAVVERITTWCLAGHCITIDHERILPGVNVESCSPRLRRANGESVFTAHASTRFTSQAVLDDEKTITDAAGLWVANAHSPAQGREAAAEIEAAKNITLSADKTEFVEHLLCSPAVLAAGIGPAGAGKTTAMEVFARAWEKSGNTVIGLAPSAVAASVLAQDADIATGTIAQFIHPGSDNIAHGLDVGEGDVILVDEAGMASTRDLAELVRAASQVGAVVRLVGDPQQLTAIESGGMLAEVATATNAPVLTEINRFHDPDEADASLTLRGGDTSVIDWYISHGRVDSGLREELPGRVFTAWWDSIKQNKTALMIAGDSHTVDALNQIARTNYIDSGRVNPAAGQTTIAGGRVAAVGDTIVTRANDSTIRYGTNGRHRVKNGDLWSITGVSDDGSLTVAHHERGHKVTLPAEYVTENVELGYASTIYRSQGMTVDRAYVIPSASLDRQGLYVALSRGRSLNKIFLPDDQVPDVDSHLPQNQPMSPRQLFASIIERDGSAVTAHATLAAADADELDVPTVVAAYTELAEELAVDVVVAATADGEARALLRADWQSRRLAEYVGRLDALGADTDTILTAAIATAKTRWDATDEDKRDSFAFLVRMAVEDNDAVKILPDSDLLWTVDAPLPAAQNTERRSRILGDAELHDFVCGTYAVIQEHLDAAGDTAVSETPEWTSLIGEPHPDEREYHATWCATVRMFAAAAQRDPSLITAERITNRDELPTHLRKGLDAVDAAGRRRHRSDFLDRMIDSEAKQYITICRSNADTLRDRRAAALEEMREAENYPHLATVTAEYERTVTQAKMIEVYRRLDAECAEAQAAANASHNNLSTAVTSARIGRKQRIETASAEHAAATVRLRELQVQTRAAEEGLPARPLWDKIVAAAGNVAEWQCRTDQATITDEKTIDSAIAKIHRLDDQIALWDERAQITDGLLGARTPATAEQKQKYMARLRADLAAKRAERAEARVVEANRFDHEDMGADDSQSPRSPGPDDDQKKASNPVLVEWRRKRQQARDTQNTVEAEASDELRDQFRHVARVVTHAGTGSKESIRDTQEPTGFPGLYAYSLEESLAAVTRNKRTDRPGITPPSESSQPHAPGDSAVEL
ncbi:MobF family relaxase [Corynebacterium glyciniphilum]|nr:MobF family relaxase [Corynebacterium glyciniphilum]